MISSLYADVIHIRQGLVSLPLLINPHDARHGFSNVLKNSEVPIAFISKALGHSSISVTESYLHNFEEGQEEDYTSRLI